MRVILDLDVAVLVKLQEQADELKRSRKNYMEYLLEMKSVSDNPILDRIKAEEKTISAAIEETFKNPPTQTKGIAAYVGVADTENMHDIDTERQKRIRQLESELHNPPSKFSSSLAKNTYFHDRQKELKALIQSSKS